MTKPDGATIMMMKLLTGVTLLALAAYAVSEGGAWIAGVI